MTDQTQQEQAAPVDWQAIAQRRETELKRVGEARHRAEAELARLHEAAKRGDKCFLMAHEKRLARAEAELRRYTEAESADAAAGSYAGRAEHAEAFIAFVADTIADHEGDEWADHSATTAIRAAITRHATGQQPGPEDTDTTPTAPDPQPVPDEFFEQLAAVKVRNDATVAADMCPRCHGDNSEAFQLCATCARRAESGDDEPDDTDQAETDYDRLITAGAPAEHAARYAENGIHTPGCDCGHDGMGVAWHRVDCSWRMSKFGIPAWMRNGVRDHAIPEQQAAEHCGHLSPQTLLTTPPTECVLPPDHHGSHADDRGARWWPTPEAIDWRQRADQLAKLLAVILGEFRTLPGTRTATAHIETETLDRWQAIADGKEQL